MVVYSADRGGCVKMRNRFVLTIVAVLLFLSLKGAAFCQEQNTQDSIIFDSDSAKLFEGFSKYFVSPSKPETIKGTGQIAQGEVVFEVVKVTNLQGNNPFNVQQPVYNFGGVLVANVDALIDCVRGGTCKASSGVAIICSPNTGDSDVASLKDSVGCYIKGNGTICRVERLPSVADLKYETIFLMYDTLTAKSIVVGTDLNSDYKMTKPPSGSSVPWPGMIVYKVSNGTYTAEVQHKTTGVRYRINFNVLNLGGNNVRLTVNSVSQI